MEEIEHESQVNRLDIPWMVEWSAGLITRYVKGQSGRTAHREALGYDAQAPVAEFGEKIMYLTSKNTSKSGPRVDAKFHDGLWLGLRVTSRSLERRVE